jgi:hypothetical protein
MIVPGRSFEVDRLARGPSRTARDAAVPDTRPEIELLLAACRVLLLDDDEARIRALLGRELDWTYLVGMARRHSVMPLLHRHVNAVGGGDVPQAVREQLRTHFHENTIRNLFMTGELFKILDLFGTHGIAAIPYKGPTLAALAYGNLAYREFEDLDLLLHERDLEKARSLLIDRGFRLSYQFTPAQEAAYVGSLRELPLVSSEGVLVELHVGLTLRDYVFPVDVDRLRERLLPVSVAARMVPTFSVEDLVLILCAHGARHCWESLSWTCDLAELTRTHVEARWDLVLDEARRLHGERLVLLGFALAGELVRAPIPEVIAAQIRVDPAIAWLVGAVHRWLFCEVGDLPGPAGQSLFHLRARERWRDGARYLLSQALTPRISDWEALPLPPSFSFVYPVLRPLRLVKEYTVRWLRDLT